MSGTTHEEKGLPNLLKAFLSLFPNRNDSAVKLNRETNWRNTSRFSQLSDQQIIDSIGLSTLVRAIAVDDSTQIVAIRINFGSESTSSEVVQKLKQALSSISAKPTLYRLGAEPFMLVFLSKPVETKLITGLIENWLELHGLSKIVQVLSEGSLLPLPLQAGFAWLDDKFHATITREELSITEALSKFSDEIAANEVNVDQLFENLTLALTTRSTSLAEANNSENITSDGIVDQKNLELLGPVEMPHEKACVIKHLALVNCDSTSDADLAINFASEQNSNQLQLPFWLPPHARAAPSESASKVKN